MKRDKLFPYKHAMSNTGLIQLVSIGIEWEIQPPWSMQPPKLTPLIFKSRWGKCVNRFGGSTIFSHTTVVSRLSLGHLMFRTHGCPSVVTYSSRSISRIFNVGDSNVIDGIQFSARAHKWRVVRFGRFANRNVLVDLSIELLSAGTPTRSLNSWKCVMRDAKSAHQSLLRYEILRLNRTMCLQCSKTCLTSNGLKESLRPSLVSAKYGLLHIVSISDLCFHFLDTRDTFYLSERGRYSNMWHIRSSLAKKSVIGVLKPDKGSWYPSRADDSPFDTTIQVKGEGEGIVQRWATCCKNLGTHDIHIQAVSKRLIWFTYIYSENLITRFQKHQRSLLSPSSLEICTTELWRTQKLVDCQNFKCKCLQFMSLCFGALIYIPRTSRLSTNAEDEREAVPFQEPWFWMK